MSTQVEKPSDAGLMGKMSKARATATDMIRKNKKPALIVVLLVITVIALVFIVAHLWPEGYTAKMLPAVPWTSPDYKLLKKNHTGKTRRSDSKVDDWNKDDFVKSVTKFNNLAASV